MSYSILSNVIYRKIVGLLIGLAIFSSGIVAETVPSEIQPLKSGDKIEREIKADETHQYSVTLKQGDAIRIDLIEKGANIALSLKNGEQKEVFELDGGDGLDHEKFTFVADQNGNYLLNVKAAPAKAGKYELNVSFGAATENDKKNASAVILGKDGLKSFKKGTAEGVMGAVTSWEQALKIYNETGDEFMYAEMLGNLGVMYSMLGQKPKALEYQEKALPIIRKLGEKRKEANSLTNIGTIYATTGVVPKAIAYFEQALPLLRELGDKNVEIVLLTNLGALYSNTGELKKGLEVNLNAIKVIETLDKKSQLVPLARIYAGLGQLYLGLGDIAKALDSLQKAADFAKEAGDIRSQAYILNNLANLTAQTGDRRKAVDMFQQVVASAKIIGDKNLEAIALASTGESYNTLGEVQKSLEFFEKSAKLGAELGDKRVSSNALNSMGNIYSTLGEHEKGIEYLNKSLAIARESKLKEIEFMALQNIGYAHNNLNQFPKALEYFQQALSIAEETGNKGNQAIVLTNIADLYSNQREFEKSISYAQKAEQLSRESERKDSLATALNNIGVGYGMLGNYDKALENFTESLLLARTVGYRRSEATTQGNLMHIWQQQGILPVAIFFGKQSINNYQLLRSNIGGLDKATQRAFVKTIEADYRKLAEVLTEAGRFSEAEKVLSLLKTEEYFDYVRRDSAELDKLKARADIKPEEQKLIERYNALADRLTEIGLEFQKLEDKKRKLPDGASLSAEEQKRYEELSAQLTDANAAFRLFLEKELVAELGKTVKKQVDIDRALQAKLRQWGEGTTALYTIAGEDRYRVILTTASVQKDAKTEIKLSELNKKIFAFREALQNPAVDPRPLGKELYDIIVKPVERDLQGAKAKTLIWSLDGALRYVPIAALWDGKQYMAQKYQNVIITSTSRQSLLAPTEKDWKALGLGVSTQQTVTDPIAPTEKINFSALPGVKTELAAIIKDEETQGESGIVNGKRLLDSEFNAKNFSGSLTRETGEGKRKYSVVHVASHFRLGGNSANSFLLLGDGTTLTLEQIADSPEMTFEDVELVTLSACNTAFGDDSNGKEVDSLATFIEMRGAKAVMATLWAVADESTQLLMSEFYRQRQANPNLTKAEAMQKAQLAMIEGRIKSSGKTSGCRADLADPNATGAFKCNANAPYSHPYYWSPFVLIGNWR